MPLSTYSKDKARQFIIDVFKQADSSIRTEVGSGIRSLIVIPSSFIYSGVFEDIEGLRNLHLGNYQFISEEEMDLLATSLLVDRSQGSRSFVNLRIYPTSVEPFTLEVSPYFQSIGGATYTPIIETEFTIEDYLTDGAGDQYVTIPIMSREFGAAGRAATGDIRIAQGLPIDIIRVHNAEPTEGGLPRDDNEDFFNDIKIQINDGSLSQDGGLTDHIMTAFPEAFEVNIVDANSPLMMRDEVWLDANNQPNLDRDGTPFATHTTIGSINFDTATGRGTVTSGEDISDLKGKRIAIPGDIEAFRFIREVDTDADQILVSGALLDVTSPVADCVVYGEGPHIGNMADAYVYFPGLQIRSTIVDKSYALEFQGNFGELITTNIPTGSTFTTAPEGGVLVYAEGTDDEKVFYPYGVTPFTAPDGTLQILFGISGYDAADNVAVNEIVKYYDMGEIDIKPEGDIDLLPVIYVLRVEKLNPLSRLVDSEISESAPGANADPGWYIKNTDPVEVLSARENKTLVLDDKRGLESFRAINIDNATVTDTSRDGGVDTVSIGGEDFTDMEGRTLIVTVPAQTLTKPALGTLGDATSPVIVNYVGAEGSTDTLSAVGLGAEWFVGEDYDTGVDGQPSITVETYLDDGPPHTLLDTYTDIVCRGDYIVNPSGNWPAGIKRVALLGQGDPNADPAGSDYSRPETEYSTVVTSGANGSFDTFISDGFWMKHDGNDATGAIVNNVEVDAEATFSDINRVPVRVTYATHSGIQDLQDTVDDGDIRNLCSDTLIRSQMPSLVDMTLRFRGGSTAEEMQTRFIELMQFASRLAAESSTEVKLDINNIIAALDEEGLADFIDTNFEVRVTNYLADGEFEIRYLNPSEATKRNMAIETATVGGETLVVLRKLADINKPIPGRGKLFLGGNNPSTQEILPYEGVIDKGDGTFEFILRGGSSVVNAHPQWETAIVTVRDYDPLLEMNNAIIIPVTNKPYVRQLVVIKLA